MMCGSHATAVLCTLLIPVPCLAQQPDTIFQPVATVTAGLGVSYAGFGAVGELYLGQRWFSVLLGVGALPETDATAGLLGVSLGLRAYSGGSKNRFYLEVTGASLEQEGDRDIYGPAALAGYSHIADDGRTFNVGVGAGRATDGSTQPAFNIGFGYTWGRYRPR